MRTLGKLILFLGALLVALVSLASIFDADRQSPIFRQIVTVVPWAGLSHVVGGSLALILGGFQLSARLRRRNLAMHRFVGNCYVFCVAIATLGAVVTNLYSRTPWPAKSAFVTLSIAWPVVTLLGYPRGGRFDVRWHGRWMLTSYALTWAAVTLRIYLGGMLASGVPFRVAYPIAAWGAMIGNWAFIEWWLRGSKRTVVAATPISGN